MVMEIIIGATFLGAMTLLGYVGGGIIGDIISNIIYE